MTRVPWDGIELGMKVGAEMVLTVRPREAVRDNVVVTVARDSPAGDTVELDLAVGEILARFSRGVASAELGTISIRWAGSVRSPLS